MPAPHTLVLVPSPVFPSHRQQGPVASDTAGAALRGCQRVPCHDSNPSLYNLQPILNLALSFGDFPALTHSTIAGASELQHRSFLCTSTASVPAAEGGGL